MENAPARETAVTRLLHALGFAAGVMGRWEAWVLGMAPQALRASFRVLAIEEDAGAPSVAVPWLGPVSLW